VTERAVFKTILYGGNRLQFSKYVRWGCQLELELAFGSWAGQKWIPTYRHLDALRKEDRSLGALRDGFRKRNTVYFPYSPNISWRHETVSVRGKIHRFRDSRTWRFIKKP